MDNPQSSESASSQTTSPNRESFANTPPHAKESVFPFGAFSVLTLIAFALQVWSLSVEDVDFFYILSIASSIVLFFAGVTRWRDFKIPETTGEAHWRTVSFEQYKHFLDSFKLDVELPPPLIIFDVIFNNALVVAIGIMLAICFAAMDMRCEALIALNLALIPWGIFNYYKYVSEPYQLLHLAYDPAQHIISELEKYLFTAKTQFCIELTASQEPVIKDKFRCNIEFPNVPKSWLCAMLSFSRNSVRDSGYIYVYFVLVIEGKAASKTSAFIKKFESLINHRWVLEHKSDAGNSIFVVRKSEAAPQPYFTSFEDIDDLLSIVNRVPELLSIPIDTNPGQKKKKKQKKKKARAIEGANRTCDDENTSAQPTSAADAEP